MKPSDGTWMPDKMWIMGDGWQFVGYARKTARHGWIARLVVREGGAQLAWAQDFDGADAARAWLAYQVTRQQRQAQQQEGN